MEREKTSEIYADNRATSARQLVRFMLILLFRTTRNLSARTRASEQHVSVCSCLQLVEQEENWRMGKEKKGRMELEESGTAYEPNREYAKLGLRKKRARRFTEYSKFPHYLRKRNWKRNNL